MLVALGLSLQCLSISYCTRFGGEVLDKLVTVPLENFQQSLHYLLVVESHDSHVTVR